MVGEVESLLHLRVVGHIERLEGLEDPPHCLGAEELAVTGEPSHLVHLLFQLQLRPRDQLGAVCGVLVHEFLHEAPQVVRLLHNHLQLGICIRSPVDFVLQIRQGLSLVF